MNEDLADSQKEVSEAQKDVNALIKVFSDNFDENTFGDLADGAKDFADSLKEVSDSDLSKDTFAEDSVDAFIDSRNEITKAAEKAAGEIEAIEKRKNNKLLQEHVDYNLALANEDKKAHDKKIELDQDTREKRFAIAQTGAQAISMIGNQLFTNAQINRDNDLNAFIEGKQVELEAAGDNAQKRAAIEGQIREKEKQANRKAAKAAKAAALFNIAISTAQAILQVTAQTGVAAPFIIPSIIALGVIQAGAVASQPLPAFEKGGVMEKTGLAQVSEAGREMIIDPKGNVTMTGNKGAELREIEGGSTILNNAITEGILSKGMINSNDVNNASSSNIQAHYEIRKG